MCMKFVGIGNMYAVHNVQGAIQKLKKVIYLNY